MDPPVSGAGVPPPVPVVVTSTPAVPVSAAQMVEVPVSQPPTPAVGIPPATAASSTVHLCLTPGDLSSTATAVAGILQLGPSSRNPLGNPPFAAISLPMQAPSSSAGILFIVFLLFFFL